MNWISRLLGKDAVDVDPLVVVPIPPLVAILQHEEAAKGAPLTQSEVIAIRDGAVCMTLPSSGAEKLAAARGYADIDPERAWEEWKRVRPRKT